MVEEIEDNRPVFDEDVGNIVGVVFANGPDHGDALVAGGPVPFDVAVERVEELVIESGRGREVIEFVDGGVWLGGLLHY